MNVFTRLRDIFSRLFGKVPEKPVGYERISSFFSRYKSQIVFFIGLSLLCGLLEDDVSIIWHLNEWGGLIAVVAFIVAICVIFGLLFGGRKVKTKKKTLVSRNDECESNYDYLESDSGTAEIDKKILNRDLFIRQLFTLLIKRNQSESMCFGLYGKWGEGKTWVWHEVEEKLKNERCIVLEFCPWEIADRRNWTYHLLQCIARELESVVIETTGGELSSESARAAVLKYAKYFRNKDVHDKLKQIPVVNLLSDDVGTSDTDCRELHNNARDLLSKLMIPIIVAVDDLDRVEYDDVFEILKTIKVFCDLPYVRYVLMADKQHLINALETKFACRVDGEMYLQKIVGFSIPLPEVSSKELCELYIARLKCFVEAKVSAGVIGFTGCFFSEGVQENELERLEKLSGLFLSLRDVKRAYNQFLVEYAFQEAKTAGEDNGTRYFNLNVADLAALAAVKAIEFDVYERLLGLVNRLKMEERNRVIAGITGESIESEYLIGANPQRRRVLMNYIVEFLGIKRQRDEEKQSHLLEKAIANQLGELDRLKHESGDLWKFALQEVSSEGCLIDSVFLNDENLDIDRAFENERGGVLLAEIDDRQLKRMKNLVVNVANLRERQREFNYNSKHYILCHSVLDDLVYHRLSSDYYWDYVSSKHDCFNVTFHAKAEFVNAVLGDFDKFAGYAETIIKGGMVGKLLRCCTTTKYLNLNGDDYEHFVSSMLFLLDRILEEHSNLIYDPLLGPRIDPLNPISIKNLLAYICFRIKTIISYAGSKDRVAFSRDVYYDFAKRNSFYSFFALPAFRDKYFTMQCKKQVLQNLISAVANGRWEKNYYRRDLIDEGLDLAISEGPQSEEFLKLLNQYPTIQRTEQFIALDILKKIPNDRFIQEFVTSFDNSVLTQFSRDVEMSLQNYLASPSLRCDPDVRMRAKVLKEHLNVTERALKGGTKN